MSSNVRSYGFIAKLITPISKEARVELEDQLDDVNSALRFNYQGTLVHLDFNLKKSWQNREDIYVFTVGTPKDLSVKDFLDECALHNIEIDQGMILPFDCIWYNGSDNPVCELKLTQFELHAFDELQRKKAAKEALP